MLFFRAAKLPPWGNAEIYPLFFPQSYHYVMIIIIDDDDDDDDEDDGGGCVWRRELWLVPWIVRKGSKGWINYKGWGHLGGDDDGDGEQAGMLVVIMIMSMTKM